jgi:hypothetical protein
MGALFGPIGGLLGGVIGSVIGYIQSDTYDGSVLILNKIEGDHRERLVQEVSDILIKAGAIASTLNANGGLGIALTEFATQTAVRDQIWGACVNGMGASSP